MKTILFKTILLVFLVSLISCGGRTDVVDSGKYEGTISEVEPAKDEIYVETPDGKTLELYFTEETKLTRDGKAVDFNVLEEGQKVMVEVKKVGKRLDPLVVKIEE